MRYPVALWQVLPAVFLVGMNVGLVAFGIGSVIVAREAGLVTAAIAAGMFVMIRATLFRPSDKDSALTLASDGLTIEHKGAKDTLAWNEVEGVDRVERRLYPEALTWPTRVPTQFVEVRVGRDVRINRLPVAGRYRLLLQVRESEEELVRDLEARIEGA